MALRRLARVVIPGLFVSFALLGCSTDDSSAQSEEEGDGDGDSGDGDGDGDTNTT
jgi:hypothetical protein